MMSTLQVETSSPAVAGEDLAQGRVKHAAWIVVGVALLARLLALPFWTLYSGDSVSRVLLGWLWGEHPFFITHGGWGPLHFYMLGAAMTIWPDPVWTPTALQILCGALTSLFIYRFALALFGGQRAALLAGLAFAVYPLAIIASLEARAEMPFVMFLALGLWLLARASGEGGRVSDALLAGFSLTLACMIRYESWVLLPFLAALLWPHWRRMAAFLAAALLHPVIWMIGSALAYGNPLYSFVWTSSFNRDLMGQKRNWDLSMAAHKIWDLALVTERGLSLPLSVLIGLGALWCLRHRLRCAYWLIPPLVAFGVLAAGEVRGSLWLQPAYTLTIGVLIVPFVAAGFEWWKVEQWPAARFIGATAALLGAVALSTIAPLWAVIPHGGWIFSAAAGTFTEDKNTNQILALINGGHPIGDGALVTDFLGWQPTGYLTARTKVRPENVCTPNGTPVPMDIPALQLFLLRHPQGTIVTREGGKLTGLLKMSSADTASLADVILKLSPIGTVKWPGTEDAPEVGPGSIGVAHYAVVKAPESPTKAKPACDAPCPISFCSA
jgi:hypothetical protein